MAERKLWCRAWRDRAAEPQAEPSDGVLDGHAADFGVDAGRRGAVVDAVNERKPPVYALMTCN